MTVHKLQTAAFLDKISIPIGTITGLTGRKEDSQMFLKFSSFIEPGVIFSYDFSEEKPSAKVFRTTSISDFDPSLFKVEQVFYPSKDGTKIPMFIVSHKV